MKRYIVGILTGFISIFLISCSVDDDSYSLNDSWLSFGILHKDPSSNMGYFIRIDEGDKIIPIASDVYFESFKDSSRVVVNYTILGNKADSIDFKEYYVKINSMHDILMKGILDISEALEDSIGNDPIIVRNAWISNNLLNFELKYWGEHKIHYINLVKQPGPLTAADQPISLELRHNDNGDSHSIPYVAYVSFDLSAIKIANLDSVRFKVSATDYDGILYTEDGVYKYGDN
jgi:hypothetical protein